MERNKIIVVVLFLALAVGFFVQKVLNAPPSNGTRILLQVNEAASPEWKANPQGREQIMDEARSVFQKRIRSTKLAGEPRILIQGEDQFVIDLPGITSRLEADNIVSDLAAAGSLELYVLSEVRGKNNPAGKWQMQTDHRNIGARDVGSYIFTGPGGVKLNSSEQPEAVFENVVGVNPLDPSKSARPAFTGKDLLPNVKAVVNDRNQVVLDIEFNEPGAEKFRQFTRDHVGDILAIFYNRKLLTAPKIMEPITNGRAEITGFIDLKTARFAASTINSGSLPVEFRVVSVNVPEKDKSR